MSLYIVTLAEMKAELGISDTTDDAVLTEWIEGLQGRFDEYLCRTLLRSAEATEYFNGGGRFLYVERFPVESVASVHIDADQEWDDDSLLESDDEYRVQTARGKIGYGLYGTAKWPAGFENIRVVYAGGYVACDGTPESGQTAMPDAIRRAFFMQLGFEWRNRRSLGVGQVTAGGGTINFNAQVSMALKGLTMLPEVESTLTPFKRLV